MMMMHAGDPKEHGTYQTLLKCPAPAHLLEIALLCDDFTGKFLKLGEVSSLLLCSQSAQQNRDFKSCLYELVVMADIKNNSLEKLLLDQDHL